MVTVYSFRRYDKATGSTTVFPRMATRAAVHALGDEFSVVEGTAQVIDEADLDPAAPGMTGRPVTIEEVLKLLAGEG